MSRKATLLVLLGLFAAASAGAKPPVTPPPGSPLRKAILDPLRVSVGKELGKKPEQIVFRVDRLKVRDGWAFLLGAPLQVSGKRMDYRGTRYEQARREGMFGDGICALLRLRGNRWRVVVSVIGATDVPYEDWDRRFKAPAALFR